MKKSYDMSKASKKLLSRSGSIVRGQKSYLICCCGKTEIEYFKMLRGTSCRGVSSLHPKLTSKDPKTMLIKAKREAEKMEYDEVWLVFDVDDFSSLEELLVEAKNHSINVAISNISIEVWFLLHFEFFECCYTVRELEAKIEGHVQDIDRSFSYKKGDLSTLGSILESKTQIAINNMKKLESILQKNEIDPLDKRGSYTSVGKLVSEITRSET